MKHRFIHTLPLIAALLGIAALTPLASSAAETDPQILPTEDHSAQSDVMIETKPDKPFYRLGDTDVNGKLDTADLKLMSRVLQGKEILSGEAAVNADMNGDGEIDVFDLALMKRNLRENVVEYKDLTPTVRMDMTRDGNDAAWSYAYAGNQIKTNVISASSALKTYLRNFPAAVSRSLLKTYDDAFFKDNVLILHYDVCDGGEEIQEFSGLAYKDGKLTVTTKLKQTKDSREAIMIWQIALPKEQYNGEGADWTEQDAVYFKAGHSIKHLSSFNEDAKETLWNGVLVTTPEEELAFRRLLSDPDGIKEYPPGFLEYEFQENAIFYRLVSVGIGSEHTIWQTRRVGDRIIADVKCTAPTAIPNNPVWALEVMTIPAEYAADKPSVEIRETSGGAYFDTDGTQCYFRNTLPDTPDLVVTQYRFGDEYETAFFWREYGSSITPEMKLIASEEVSADASRFHDRDAKNGEILKDDAEVFSIEWGDTGVTVTFLKSKSDGKPTLLHFPYPKQ